MEHKEPGLVEALKKYGSKVFLETFNNDLENYFGPGQ